METYKVLAVVAFALVFFGALTLLKLITYLKSRKEEKKNKTDK